MFDGAGNDHPDGIGLNAECFGNLAVFEPLFPHEYGGSIVVRQLIEGLTKKPAGIAAFRGTVRKRRGIGDNVEPGFCAVPCSRFSMPTIR